MQTTISSSASSNTVPTQPSTDVAVEYQYYQPYDTFSRDPSRLRPLMSLEDYAKQGREFTSQELKKAHMWWPHFGSVHVQRLREYARKTDSRVWWALAVVLCAISLMLLGACFSSGQQYDGQLVPLSLPQRIVQIPLAFLDFLREFTGQGRKGLPSNESVFRRPPTNNNGGAQPRSHMNSGGAATANNQKDANATASNSREAQQPQHHHYEEGRTSSQQQEQRFQYSDEQQQQQQGELVVEDSPFASFFSRGSSRGGGGGGSGGLNIFAFAYTAAYDLASSIYALAFGAASA